ncbi:vitamin B12 dependent-methionine synthase activation domain-containing protein [Clostridium celatum]|uniref:vitamin B12 dependent-methionine synthase activation domain-containing protein n=1 Tax=Clostridium celatum TaxID=36834 RepID=UPI001897679F|nr:vitamin B12 dependent-methionine synthase activation domain-containing protein [Clostridium celatum]MDU6294709.1 vitamin B12 dependent-methionine synthase activation domain-containing protein [Clostridium celatum]
MVNRDEVLRYLGFRGQIIDEKLEELIDECRETVVVKSDPKYVYGYFNIENNDEGILIKDTTLVLKGEDIKNHLKHCDKCALMVVTLGLNIEREIILNEKVSLTKSIVLDSCATTYIEEVCDNIQNDIEQFAKKNNLNITSRYSPGYGDLSLDSQEKILSVTDASKRIGVTTTEHNILFPRKSVTAIIGLSKGKIQKTKRDCTKCNKYNDCVFRKGGSNCGS